VNRIDRRNEIEEVLKAGGVYDSSDRIERWIRRAAAPNVRLGEGEWAYSPETELGKPIYRLHYGSVTLTLLQLGFSYEGPGRSFECRYTDLEEIEGPSLKDYMLAMRDRDPDKMLVSTLTIRVEPYSIEMELSARSGWVVPTIGRIVREFN
jgi:hypothetical protein